MAVYLTALHVDKVFLGIFRLCVHENKWIIFFRHWKQQNRNYNKLLFNAKHYTI